MTLPLKKNYLVSNSNILEPYIKEQKDFCDNPNKYINEDIEAQIELSKVNVDGITFPLYVPKRNVGMTLNLLDSNQFEEKVYINIFKALHYYKYKKDITSKEDIFMLDI
jgi:hypothetical protein